jgi:hypothetical protein
MNKLVAIVASTFFSVSVAAQSLDKGQAICYEAQNMVNGLVDYTNTTCIPSLTSTGALSFIFLSSQPVFSSESSKKAWLLVVVASVGKIFNEQSSLKAGDLVVSDANQMKNRVAYTITVSTAKSLQRQVYSGQLGLEGMYTAISKSLVRKDIPKK